MVSPDVYKRQVEAGLAAAADRYAESHEVGKTAPGYQFMRLGYFCLDNKDTKAGQDVYKRQVQMMSIHKSKGLEFPIVFLCDLEHAFSRQDFDTPVLVHPALGLGPLCIDLKRKIRYPTMARLALEEKLRRENLAEEQRIRCV